MIRITKATQSGCAMSRKNSSKKTNSSAYQPAYTPGDQDQGVKDTYSRQTAAGQYSRNNPQYSSQAGKRMGRGKKIALGLLSAFVVAAIGCGTAFALYVNSINQELSGNKTVEELQALQDVLTPVKNFSDPFYFMLIGSDRRDDDPTMGARSDTNIVIRVDPANNLATMISIPRDTKVDIDGAGPNKFNAAYNYGGASAAIQEASQLLDVEISHYAEVNFEELIQLVDVVGGVDVEVSERIDDRDADGSSANPSWEHFIIEEGLQHLNGEEALVFARSRAYADGDFTRSSNQRELITALANKVLAMPVTELPGIVQKAAKSVTTDMSVTDVVALAQQFKDAGNMTTYSAMVPSTTGYVGDVSYVFADKQALTEMMKLVEAGSDPSGITASADAAAQQGASTSGTLRGSSGTGSSGYSSTTGRGTGS